MAKAGEVISYCDWRMFYKIDCNDYYMKGCWVLPEKSDMERLQEALYENGTSRAEKA